MNSKETALFLKERGYIYSKTTTGVHTWWFEQMAIAESDSYANAAYQAHDHYKSQQVYLKVLVGERSTFQNTAWPLPTQNEDGTWEAGAWYEVEGDIELCNNGLHVCTEAQLWKLWAKWGMTVYHAECEGDSDEDEEKSAFRRVRLTHPFTSYPQWWIDTILSLELIKNIPYCQPDGNPKPEWKLFTAPTLDAARAAARDAAWDAARAAARAAARDAAWDAARDAAGDARLNTYMALTSDLDIDQKHRDHAKARTEVWQKGYCLLCDVDGTLYVYSQE